MARRRNPPRLKIYDRRGNSGSGSGTGTRAGCNVAATELLLALDSQLIISFNDDMSAVTFRKVRPGMTGMTVRRCWGPCFDFPAPGGVRVGWEYDFVPPFSGDTLTAIRMEKTGGVVGVVPLPPVIMGYFEKAGLNVARYMYSLCYRVGLNVVKVLELELEGTGGWAGDPPDKVWHTTLHAVYYGERPTAEEIKKCLRYYHPGTTLISMKGVN